MGLKNSIYVFFLYQIRNHLPCLTLNSFPWIQACKLFFFGPEGTVMES